MPKFAFTVHSWMTVTVGFLMYVVPNLTALYYDCVMFYLVDFIYSNGMSQYLDTHLILYTTRLYFNYLHCYLLCCWFVLHLSN